MSHYFSLHPVNPVKIYFRESAVPHEEVMADVDVSAINDGDVAWVMISSALVMLMTPGLAFFYGGMVASKNIISTLMQSFFCLGVITVIWIIYGFSLCFGTGSKKIFHPNRLTFLAYFFFLFRPWRCDWKSRNLLFLAKSWISSQQRFCWHHSTPALLHLPNVLRSDHSSFDFRCGIFLGNAPNMMLMHNFH